MKKISLALLLGFFLSSFGRAYADDSALTVAVLDFAVEGQNTNAWGWAKGGMADLLQVELDQRGLVLLDRSFIQIVLSEHERAVGGLVSSDCKSIATLLGVRCLVRGKVTPLEGGKCRIEASAFSVETVATMAMGAGEGVLSKELPVLLQQIADQLVAGIRKGQKAAVATHPVGYVPNAEALIAYYRGMNALADGQPEAAVAWFVNSSGLDKDFIEPQLWEIQAYKIMGLDDHVRVREAETAALFKQAGLAVELTTNQTRAVGPKTVAVLSPLVVGQGAKAFRIDSAALDIALKQALVATRKARLFEADHMDDALVEHDRMLNPLFSRRNALRYGRWAAVDALLFCRVDELSSGAVQVRLSFRNPLTGVVVAEVAENAAPGKIEARAVELTQRLLNDWSAGVFENSDSMIKPIAPANSRSGDTNGVPENVHAVMVALNKIRSTSGDYDGHRAWADALCQNHRHRQSAMEIEKAITALDNVPYTAHRLADTCKWLTRMDRPFGTVSGQSLLDPAVFTNGIGRMPTLRYVDPVMVWRPTQLLLNRFPDDLETASVIASLATDYWQVRKWDQACQYAAMGREVLKKKDFNALPLDKLFITQTKIFLRVIANLYYVEVDSLAEMGRFDQARLLLAETEDFVRHAGVAGLTASGFEVVNHGSGLQIYRSTGGLVVDAADLTRRQAGNAVGGVMDYSDQDRAKALYLDILRNTSIHVTWGDGAQINRAKWKLADQLVTLYEGLTNNQADKDAVYGYVADALSLTYYHSPRSECAGQIKIWETMAIANEMDGLSDFEISERAKARGLLLRVVHTLLRQEGIPDFNGADKWAPERLQETAFKIICLCETSGAWLEWPSLLRPLFDDPYSPTLGFALILRGSWLSEAGMGEKIRSLASRLPGGEKAVPFAVWMKVAEACSYHGQYQDALQYYQAGFKKGAPVKHYANLGTALIGVALDKAPEHVNDEIRRLFQRMEIPPFQLEWMEWLHVGSRFQEVKQYEKAAVAYQHVLERFDSTHFVDSQQWQIGEETMWGRVPLMSRSSMTWCGKCYDQESVKRACRYSLAQSLVKAGRKDDAALLLRQLAKECGSTMVEELNSRQVVGWGPVLKPLCIGTEAAKLLAELHIQMEEAFSTEDSSAVPRGGARR